MEKHQCSYIANNNLNNYHSYVGRMKEKGRSPYQFKDRDYLFLTTHFSCIFNQDKEYYNFYAIPHLHILRTDLGYDKF